MPTQAEIQRLRDELAAAEAATSPFVENGDSPAARQRATDAFNALEQALNEAPSDSTEPVFTQTSTGLNVLEEEINEDPVVNRPTAEPDPGAIDTSARNSGASASADTTLTDWQKEVNRTQATTDTPISGNRSGVPKGATSKNPVAANAEWAGAKDLRAKLRVPAEYLVGPGAGPSNILKQNSGILFPYTPQISMQNQATYAQNTPLHSNYPLYFFKSGSVGPIQVTAKFTVQNEFEGAVLLGVIHLLRGLTKMKWGDDPDAGAPPPVCRFDAYGDYMMQNVPVAIASWRHELSENCDYIAVGRPGSPGTYGRSMVPTMSTISIDLNVMYSRQEMLAYNVKQWQGGLLQGKGYL